MPANINFETDTRHEVTNRLIKNYEKVGYAQDNFGVDKYNTPLHHSLPFGWLQMMREELVDAGKYLECELERKAQIVRILEAGLRVDEDKNSYILTALELLTMEHTGK